MGLDHETKRKTIMEIHNIFTIDTNMDGKFSRNELEKFADDAACKLHYGCDLSRKLLIEVLKTQRQLGDVSRSQFASSLIMSSFVLRLILRRMLVT